MPTALTDCALTCLHADEALLVLLKPAGLLSVPGRGADKQDCASARASQQWPGALVVHRLDMATSGLLLMARTPALSSVAVSLSVMVWPSAGYSSAGATETVVGIVIEPLSSFGIAMGAVSRKAGRRHANRICIVTYTSANLIIRNGGNISVSLCICNDFTESREYNIVTYQS